MRIGILALQGDFAAHQQAFARLGTETTLVRTPSAMDGIHALVLPGGESTTIWKMMEWSGLTGPIRDWASSGRPLLATCAGAILCASSIDDLDQPTLEVADVAVRRNAYGRQRESFEAPLDIPSLGDKPFPGIFIRSPQFTRLGKDVDLLCEHDGKAVLVRAGSLLLSAFHPELTEDLRLHDFFLQACGAPAPAKSS
ncbi:MAG: pyridoxal 5'-phosphate synthase glutaminase subunit PdxT [Planctomycetota bacterium]|nr:pyridoxal 5'-phosphate synthase glutaminase subunit PdxT [Planctomycetota bacterium]